MTTTADLLYGRRGGRWASPDAGRHAQAITDALAASDQATGRFDPRQVFHPAAIARARAHDRRRPGSCAKDEAANRADRRRTDCTCPIDPGDLDAIWVGRARMARARHNAGQALDDIDRQALAHRPHDATTPGAAGDAGPAHTGPPRQARPGAGQLALDTHPTPTGAADQ
jgi:hypothetical protein